MIQKHWRSVTALAAAAILSGGCGPNKDATAPPVLESKEKIVNAQSVLIDNRSSEEYASGHVKGALLMPYDAIDGMIEAKVPDKATPILLYCRSGRRAESAKQMLQSMGYENVKNLGSLENAAAETGHPIVDE